MGKTLSRTQFHSIYRGSMLLIEAVFIRADSEGPHPKCPFNEICLGLMEFDFWRPMHHSQKQLLNSQSTLPERSMADIQKPFLESVILYKQRPTLLSLLCGRGLLGSMALRVKGPALPKPLSTLAPCNLGISSLATSLRAGD